MSKYIITDKNINYDSSYSNIPYFANETERDNYVNNYLLSDYKNKLANRPELGKKINTPLSDTIQIQDTFENIMNKNYMIIEKDNKYYFYFIDSITNVNNKTFILSITKDLVMTYPAIFDKVKNVKLTQSHLNNYYGYQMDGGYKEILSVTDFPYADNENEVYNQLKNKGWLVVMERVNDESEYLSKVSKGNDYKEPFKVYIAPLTPFQVAEEESNEIILYEQPSPTEYTMILKDEMTSIVLGLSESINNDLSLNIFYTYRRGTSSFSYNFSITDYVINEEQFILFPVLGDVNQAMTINKEIRENGIYNDTVRLNAGNGVDFLPIKLLYDGTNFTINFTTIDEFLVYIPNATKAVSTSEYWSPYSYASEELGYGNKYGLVLDYDLWLSFNKISQTQNGFWSSDNLFNYLEDPENANIITAKTTNFIPIDTPQKTGIFSILQSNNISKEDNIYRLNNINYDNLLKVNTYSLDISEFSKYDLIEGLNKYALAIENQKEFSINPNFITDNNTIDFEHYASFTPNWEERFKYINSRYISLTNAENSFVNNKEFIKGTDIVAQYKVNNPVTSKLEWFKPFFSAGNIAAANLGKSAAGWMKRASYTQGDIVGSILNNSTKVHYANRDSKVDLSTSIARDIIPDKVFNWSKLGGEISRILPFIGDLASTGINRANMKRQPDEFQGNGDINGDLIFNENSIKFSLIEYNFITPERDSVINDIKRYGITTNIYISNLKDPLIKQKSFNNFVISELDNSDNQELIELLSNEEYREFASIIAAGVRLWWDITKWKDWDSNE